MAYSIEQLRIAEAHARRALFDNEPTPAALVRTWPYVTAAARTAQAAVAVPNVHRTIERVALIGDGLHEANQRHHWPGKGPLDSQLQRVARSLAAATDHRGGVRADRKHAEEASRLIAGTLWATAHLVARETRDHVVDLQAAMRRGAEPIVATERDLARDAFGRAAATEQMTASAILDKPAHVSEPVRTLAGAVADWDVQSHRALLTNRSTSALVLVAQNEASIQRGFANAVATAQEAGVIDEQTVRRLAPVLTRLSCAWQDLADQVIDLNWGSEMVPRSTLESAGQLRRQFVGLDLAGQDRASHAATLDTFSSHLSSSMALSVATRELLHDGQLRAPARAINRLLIENTPPELEKSRRAAVSPVDLMRGTSISLPREARSFLQGHVDRVYFESEEAVRRGASLDALRRQDADRRPPGRRESAAPPAPLPGLGYTSPSLGLAP